MAGEAPKKAPTKTEILNSLAEATDVPKKDVANVIEALEGLIRKSLSDDGPGSFVLPGLLKIEKKYQPAKPAKTGVPNPFKPGELMDVAAKPECNKIKLRALKNLKDMV
jgi:nucleoid DNA-binding protein